MVNFLSHLGRGLLASEPAGAFMPAVALSRLGSFASQSAELRSLAEERNPELFYEGLLSYAGRLERQGHHSQSRAILGIVAQGPEATLAARARQRLQALEGSGEVGARAEVLLGRLVDEVTDPAALLAMGGAGAIYRLSRFAFLARLGAGPAGALTRGFGQRFLASSLAFSAEATSFPLLTRAGNLALGRSQEWYPGQIGQEIGSSFFALGGLRVAGLGAAFAIRRSGAAAAWLGPVFQQGAMLGGILAGHRLEELAGLRPSRDGATNLIDGLALLLQFNLAGRLSQEAFGPGFRRWEMELDWRSQSLASSPSGGAGPLRSLASSLEPNYVLAAAGRPELPAQMGLSVMQNRALDLSPSGPSGPRLPKMGLRGEGEPSSMTERLNRQEAERVLRELIPRGLAPERLNTPGLVESLLQAFGVPSHPFDVQAFRDGYQIARQYPERVARLAFDFDEVALHWAFGPRDVFNLMARGAEAAYFHTPRQVLDYEAPAPSQGHELKGFDRLWFQGTQRLFPMAFRQHLQFHPGMRALQLGLRLGQDRNLVLVTVGPAGRLMRLANEDAALKMIYFGRLPTDEITIGEVRGATNIYSREDIVQALRAAEEGELRFPRDVRVQNYLELLRRHPEAGNRLKHPALALLRGKRPFDALVDDSAFALETLGTQPGFTVFQVPSARPSRTKNFTLGSVDAYLARSANGYVDALAQRLLEEKWSSGPVENRAAPENYPYQRLAIEIPWKQFGSEYVALGKEARDRGRALAEGRALAALPASNGASREPLSLSESQTQLLVERLYREFDILLDGRPGEVSIEADNTLMLKEMAAHSAEDFQASLDSYFTPEEQVLLPQAARPLAERNEKFYSRVASLMAVKTAICNLLGLDVAEHAREIRFRFGNPLLSGLAAHRLNGNSLLATLSDDGEVGIGIALIEPDRWDSGLVGIGVDLTTSRVRYTEPERHALAEAAFKAAYPAHIRRQFSHHRTNELVATEDGGHALTGRSMRAARDLRGDSNVDSPLPIRTLSFQVGPATVGLVAIPALPRGLSFHPRVSNFPYRIDEEGRFQLPRPGMTVAVLGDVNATRTLQLVRKGHYVVHIERDPDMAELAERMVQRFLRDEGPSIGQPSDNSVIRADWYDAGVNADLVEAYFPLAPSDLPSRKESGRQAAVLEFLRSALNSKLVNGGSAFVVSEVRENIEDLAEAIRSQSDLSLLELRYEVARPPLVGGFSANDRQRVHYLVYRKNGSGSR